MRAFSFFIVALGLAGTAIAAPPANHPIIGTWTLYSPDGKCTEKYVYRANGTAQVTSGEEISEVAYNITPVPVAQGFYKYSDKITRDNGKKDCEGQVMKVGETNSMFVQFDPKNQLLILCPAPAVKDCFGPLRRQMEEGK